MKIENIIMMLENTHDEVERIKQASLYIDHFENSIKHFSFNKSDVDYVDKANDCIKDCLIEYCYNCIKTLKAYIKSHIRVTTVKPKVQSPTSTGEEKPLTFNFVR